MNGVFKLSAVALLVLSPGIALAADETTTAPGKKLIEFGWDEPDTAFMRKHIAEMERTPFDGCVFHLGYRWPDGSSGLFMWDCWGTKSFADTDLQSAIDDLKATTFTRFTHNFLRFNTCPGKVDWFDDFSAIVNNARLAARIAREGKAAGILFDIEQYDGQLFNYRKQRDAASKSWDEYAAKARERGREVIQAFQEGYPDLTVLMTWCHSLPYRQTGGDASKLADSDYGLLAPFTDGLIDEVKVKTKLVDGYESSYGYKTAEQFAEAKHVMTKGVLPYVADDARYRQFVSHGFGLWMDNQWRNVGWNTENPTSNYFTPESFEKSLHAAWQTSDQYVWIYTETPRWWSEEGKPIKLPPAYEAAVRRATGR